MRVIARCIVAALAAAPLGAQASTATPAPAPAPAPARTADSSPAQVPQPAQTAPSAALASDREVAPAPGTVRLLLRDGTTRVGRMLGLQGDDLLLASTGADEIGRAHV